MMTGNGVTCDECKNFEGFYGMPFKFMAAKIKEKGWTITPARGSFKHHCPTCRSKVPVWRSTQRYWLPYADN